MKKTTLLTTLTLSLSLVACEAITIPEFPVPGSSTAPSPSTSPSDPEPTNTPIPTPTDTPIPEATRTPSATPTPVSTPVATPTPISSASVAIPSSVMVKGLGKDLYYIFDMQGQRVESSFTNRAEELTPGNYQISVGGSSSAYQRQPITVSADQQTVLSAGSLMVTGFGDDLYYIFNELGQQVDSKFTSSPKELLPGTYQVTVGGSGAAFPRQTLVVAAGEQATTAAGTLLVTGDSDKLYYIYNTEGKQLDSKFSNRVKELLPGDYQISVGGSSQTWSSSIYSYYPRKTITVKANEQTRVDGTASEFAPMRLSTVTPRPVATCPPTTSTVPCMVR